MKSKVALWCSAYGIDLKVLEDPRVASAINDNDAVDTIRAIRMTAHTYDADAFSPMAQLQLIGLMK